MSSNISYCYSARSGFYISPDSLTQAFNASIRYWPGSSISLCTHCGSSSHCSRLPEVFRGQKVTGALKQTSLVPNVLMLDRFPYSWTPSQQWAIRVSFPRTSLQFNGCGKPLSCFRKDMTGYVRFLPYLFTAQRPVCSIPTNHSKWPLYHDGS